MDSGEEHGIPGRTERGRRVSACGHGSATLAVGIGGPHRVMARNDNRAGKAVVVPIVVPRRIARRGEHEPKPERQRDGEDAEHREPGLHNREPSQPVSHSAPTAVPGLDLIGLATVPPGQARLRGLIVVLWRAGLRIQEAPALTEADLDQRGGSLLVRRGKGGRPRGWHGRAGVGANSSRGLSFAAGLPVGPLFCIINGPTRGRYWSRAELRRCDAQAAVLVEVAAHEGDRRVVVGAQQACLLVVGLLRAGGRRRAWLERRLFSE